MVERNLKEEEEEEEEANLKVQMDVPKTLLAVEPMY